MPDSTIAYTIGGVSFFLSAATLSSSTPQYVATALIFAVVHAGVVFP